MATQTMALATETTAMEAPAPYQPKRGPDKTGTMQMPTGTTEYITSLPIDELQRIRSRAVFIDPRERDMLYCMSIDSTADNPCLYRYTSMTHRKITNSTQFKNDINNVKKATYPAVHMNWERADRVLARQLTDKFGRDAVLIIGNWNAPQAEYQEPSCGKDMHDTLKYMGFEVYLIEEFRTSKLCPDCHGLLQYVKKVSSIRPCGRLDAGPADTENNKRPMVWRHGLLGCASKQCQEQVRQRMELRAQRSAGQDTGPVGKAKCKRTAKEQYVGKFNPKHGNYLRVWNRDLASVCNMRNIFESLADGNGVPKRFWRSEKCPTMKSAADIGKSTATDERNAMKWPASDSE